jgi:hypothetical protein
VDQLPLQNGPTAGLALQTHDSAEYRYVNGELRRCKKQATVRGLNPNHNHDMKGVFKSAATQARNSAGPLTRLLCNSTRPRNEALYGPPHLGAQNCNHRFSPLEEGSESMASYFWRVDPYAAKLLGGSLAVYHGVCHNA